MTTLLGRRAVLCAAGAATLFPSSSFAIGGSMLHEQTPDWKSLGRGRKPVVLGGPSAKWACMIKRHAEQEKKGLPTYPGCRWLSMCHEIAGLSPDLNAADTINRLANDVPYRSERKDHWATPREFANGGGDCEDFAIAKYFLLKRIGFADENLGILVCLMNKNSNIPHALSLIKINEKTWILDNLSKKLSIFEYNKKIIPIHFHNEKYAIGFL